MRIAYLYDQDEKDADHMNAERVRIDTPATKRLALSAILDEGDGRRGDTIIVTAKSKLGHGQGSVRIARKIEAASMSLEVSPSPLRPSNLRRQKKSPKPDDLTYLKGVWTSSMGEGAALGQASLHMGFKVGREWMNYHVSMRDGGLSTKARNQLNKDSKESSTDE